MMASRPILILAVLCLLFYQSNASTTISNLRDSVHFGTTIVNFFLDVIRGPATPDLLPNATANFLKDLKTEITFTTVKPYVTSYVGYAICLVLGILFCILLPIVGLFFCCCRCCGRCGGRAELMDAKRDPCRRVVYTVCLALLTTVQLAAIVLAFINHHLLHEAIVNQDVTIGALPQLNRSLYNTELAVKEMIQLAKNTTTVNMDYLKKQANIEITNGLMKFQYQFVTLSNYNSIKENVNILHRNVQRFTPTGENALQINDFFQQLKTLENDLPQLQQMIEQFADPHCKKEFLLECQEFAKNALPNLVVNFTDNSFQRDVVMNTLDAINMYSNDFSKLDAMDASVQSLSETLKTHLQPYLDHAWTELANKPEYRQKLDNVLEVVSEQSSHVLQTTRTQLAQVQKSEINGMINKVEEYRLYGGIGLLCLPVLNILFIYLGLCFGVCGGRPYEDASLCNRGVGANLLMAAVIFIFCFSTLLMIVCTLVFMVGGPIQTEICRYLTNHYPHGTSLVDQSMGETIRILRQQNVFKNDNSDMRLIISDENTASLLANLTKHNMTDAVLNRCGHETFVNAINAKLMEFHFIDEAIDPLLQKIMENFDGAQLIAKLQEEITSALENLNRANTIKLVDLSQALRQFSYPLTKIENTATFLDNFKKYFILATGKEKLVSELETLVAFDESRMKYIMPFSDMNELRKQYTDLIAKIQTLKDNVKHYVDLSISTSMNDVRPSFIRTLRLAVIATWSEIPCKKLHASANDGVNSVCYTLLSPLNGFWLGLGVYLLLVIPVIIFAVKLAGLYRKTEKYTSDYEEPDYVAYQGFYMQAPREYNVEPHKKGKSRKNKDKSQSHASGTRGFSYHLGQTAPNARYQQVSVYPYDAYE